MTPNPPGSPPGSPPPRKPEPRPREPGSHVGSRPCRETHARPPGAAERGLDASGGGGGLSRTQKERLRGYLLEMPVVQRQVVMMRLVDGLTGREVAAVTGWPLEHVEHVLAGAVMFIRAKMTRDPTLPSPAAGEVEGVFGSAMP